MTDASLDGLRARFLDARSFPLDPFQDRALELLDAGKSVLVAAPTGAGKTVVAEYAIERAMATSQRSFYTTPLKALSNQKYNDLITLHGDAKVGLLTGDVSINPDAQVVVMTTEVLRNMIYASTDRLLGLGCVILDEVHYLEDPYRGAVWEEVILSTPRDVVLVCLSATVSNAEELAGWIHTVRGSTGAVIEEHRPIALENIYLAGDRAVGNMLVLPTFVDGLPNPEAMRIDKARRATTWRYGSASQRRGARSKGGGAKGQGRANKSSDEQPIKDGPARYYRPRRIEVIDRLADKNMLPAICFVFSRAGCNEAVSQCMDAGVKLTNPEERREIREIVNAHVARLDTADLEVLGYRRFLAGAESGIAAHHAGLIPPFREAIEACFGKALVKVVFATETLALGINMPARTVVIEQLSKYSGAGHVDLTPGEYTQLTGRAGRRGIDDVGFGAVLWSPYHRFAEVANLAGSRSRALRSSFRPTYNMAVNLVRRYNRDSAYRLVRSSFAQYLSERPLTHQLDAVIDVLSDRGYLIKWQVTPSGNRLAGIYHERDLLLVEALESGLLGGLDSPSLAAVVSSLVHEPRRGAESASYDTISSRLNRRFVSLQVLAEEIAYAERRAGLPETRPIDAGFARLAYEWARGADLRDLLAPPERPKPRRRSEPKNRSESPLTAGDFVRTMKQLVDLLRQLSEVAVDSRVGMVANRSAELLRRGIVAATSGPGLHELSPEEDLDLEELEIE